MHIRSLEWVDRFQRYLTTEQRVSPHTASAYRLEVAALVAYCDNERIESWDAVLVPQIRNFAARSHAGGLSPRSVQRRLSAVRTFMNFLVREGIIGGNPAKVVTAPRVTRKLPSVLTAQEMAKLIEIPDTDTYSIRDRAIMELLYSSALRLIELVRLDCVDIDLRDRVVTVLGKGNKTRLVPVGSFAVAALQKWLRVRRRFTGETEKALFVGHGGRRLGPRVVQTRIDQWARERGISTHVHPHMFRHACATHVLESSGSSIREIQELLGHASISTTQIYTQLNATHLVKAYQAAHPRARSKVPHD